MRLLRSVSHIAILASLSSNVVGIVPNFALKPFIAASFRSIPGSRVAVRLEIQNLNGTTLNLLKWNSILEDFAVYGVPLYLTPEPANDAFKVTDAPRAHANYVKTMASHLIRIAPFATHTHDIDLRKWFGITDLRKWYGIGRNNNYNVELKDTLRGFLHNGDLETEPFARAIAYQMPRMDVRLRVTVNLAPTVLPRAVGDSNECVGAQVPTVLEARESAEELAGFPHTYRDKFDKEWREYFNGDRRIQEKVLITFEQIFNYNRLPRGSQLGIKERCASNPTANTITPCGDGVFTYHQLQPRKDLTVVFCPGFFEPFHDMRCFIPGPNLPDMIDPAGSYLRALLWSEIGREFYIRDGNLNTCYGFFCATAAASSRQYSRLENTGRPDQRFDEGLPENIAGNYVGFAYALRAKTCEDPDQRPSLMSREMCEKLGNRVWVLLKQNARTILGTALTVSTGTCIGILFNKIPGAQAPRTP